MHTGIYIYKCGLSANASYTVCVALMWVQRRRHWSGIGPAFIFSGGRQACYTLPPPTSLSTYS